MSENNLTDSVSAILSDPAAMEKIRAMMDTYRNAGDAQTEDTERSMSMPPVTEDAMARISRAYSRMENGNDTRMNLLYAIRPYLSPTRAAHLDRAMRLLKISRFASLARDMDLFG